jgi:hypothetical protein
MGRQYIRVHSHNNTKEWPPTPPPMMINVKLYGARNINSISMVAPKKKKGFGNHCATARRELPCWGFHDTEGALYRTVPLGYKAASHYNTAFPPGGGTLWGITFSPAEAKKLSEALPRGQLRVRLFSLCRSNQPDDEKDHGLVTRRSANHQKARLRVRLTAMMMVRLSRQGGGWNAPLRAVQEEMTMCHRPILLGFNLTFDSSQVQPTDIKRAQSGGL